METSVASSGDHKEENTLGLPGSAIGVLINLLQRVIEEAVSFLNALTWLTVICREPTNT